jgi:hypothetical protein
VKTNKKKRMADYTMRRNFKVRGKLPSADLNARAEVKQ